MIVLEKAFVATAMPSSGAAVAFWYFRQEQALISKRAGVPDGASLCSSTHRNFENLS